jgi:hypothetical protein
MKLVFWSGVRETKAGAAGDNRTLILRVLMVTITLVCRADAEQPVHFSRQWAVHIEGGVQLADAIASKHGFINLGEVSFYSFTIFNLGTINLERFAK